MAKCRHQFLVQGHHRRDGRARPRCGPEIRRHRAVVGLGENLPEDPGVRRLALGEGQPGRVQVDQPEERDTLAGVEA